MPGGQYTNLREQARAIGLEHRWPEVSKAYAEVNRLFGDIVKVKILHIDMKRKRISLSITRAQRDAEISDASYYKDEPLTNEESGED